MIGLKKTILSNTCNGYVLNLISNSKRKISMNFIAIDSPQICRSGNIPDETKQMMSGVPLKLSDHVSAAVRQRYRPIHIFFPAQRLNTTIVLTIKQEYDY